MAEETTTGAPGRAIVRDIRAVASRLSDRIANRLDSVLGRGFDTPDAEAVAVAKDFLAALSGDSTALDRLRVAGQSNIADYAVYRGHADGLEDIAADPAAMHRYLSSIRAAPSAIVARWHDEASVRELKSVADRFLQSGGFALGADLTPALMSDRPLGRIVFAIEADDWRRIEAAEPEDLAERLDDLRARGRDLLERERALATDFVAALGGDEAAIDRLRRPEAEGGHGKAWLAERVPDQIDWTDNWRAMLADPDPRGLEGAMWGLEEDEWEAKERERKNRSEYEEDDEDDECDEYDEEDGPQWTEVDEEQAIEEAAQRRDRDAIAALRALAVGERLPSGAFYNDPYLRRFVRDVSADDWQRIAESSTSDLYARLDGWREQGDELLKSDRLAVCHDFISATDGDAIALDRLRASEDEGGWGKEWLAQLVPGQRGRADELRAILLNGPRDFEYHLRDLRRADEKAARDAEHSYSARAYG